jgi:PleD family two-component response regulator
MSQFSGSAQAALDYNPTIIGALAWAYILSKVYGFTRRSSGYVHIESELGKGTVVKIYLPRLSSAPVDLKEGDRKPSARAVGRESVLVVEDDDAARAYTTESLRELGSGVAEASSGKAALEIIENAHRFDLLLTDVVIPGDMNGRELEWARTRR